MRAAFASAMGRAFSHDTSPAPLLSSPVSVLRIAPASVEAQATKAAVDGDASGLRHSRLLMYYDSKERFLAQEDPRGSIELRPGDYTLHEHALDEEHTVRRGTRETRTPAST